MKFGQYSILSKAVHKLEKEPEWEWRFKPTNSQDELDLFAFMDANGRTIDVGDGKTMTLPPEWIVIAWRELALSFGGTTIPDEEGNLILDDDASIEEIEAVLKQMPVELVAELWKALGEANPLWGPRLAPSETNQEQTPSETSKTE
jgi:hypothetical protein